MNILYPLLEIIAEWNSLCCSCEGMLSLCLIILSSVQGLAEYMWNHFFRKGTYLHVLEFLPLSSSLDPQALYNYVALAEPTCVAPILMASPSKQDSQNFEKEMVHYFEECDQLKKEYLERKIAKAQEHEDGFTLSSLKLKFFLDMVGEYLGDSCVKLVCLSATLERITYD